MINSRKNTLISTARELIDNGQAKEAVKLLREYVRKNTDDAEAFELLSRACAGLMLYDEAIAFLTEAQRISPAADFSTNLGMLYYRKGNYTEAYTQLSSAGGGSVFRKHTLEAITDVEILLAFAGCAAQIGDTAAEKRIISHTRSLYPDREDITERHLQISDNPNAAAAQAKKTIAVFASDDYFLRDIIRHWKERYAVEVFSGGKLNEAAALLRQCDLVWYEWCNQLTIAVSKLPKYAPAVCRLHRYEAFTDMPQNVHWANIDHIVCVSDVIKNQIVKAVPLSIPVSIIPNGVDFEKFTIPLGRDKTYGKRAVFMGYLKKQKGPELLMQCFKKIYDYDPEYTFHIAGTFVEPDVELYLKHIIRELRLPVVFYGWIDNVPEWLRDKDYIVSTSISESFMYALVEGIGCGLLPLIHRWPGADEIYPAECLFFTVDECLNLLKKYEGSDRRAEAGRLRALMVEQYSLEKQLQAVDAVIEKYISQ